jgi:hypothetical protein
MSRTGGSGWSEELVGPTVGAAISELVGSDVGD